MKIPATNILPHHHSNVVYPLRYVECQTFLIPLSSLIYQFSALIYSKQILSNVMIGNRQLHNVQIKPDKLFTEI